jgi:hypothetical protein
MIRRKGGIFGPANCDFALQTATTGNLDFVHSILVKPHNGAAYLFSGVCPGP